ncbi:hypothetical protein D9M73_240760 [compost metagenome]
MGRRDHRIGAPDDAATRFVHAETGELAGTETISGVARGAQGEQARGERVHLLQRLAGELLFAGGHTPLPI